jgi:hypothetical protein
MSNPLKQILLKMARLPKSDQRWIISKLSNVEAQRFKQEQGEQLLLDARRFRQLKLDLQPLISRNTQNIPPFQQRLAACPRLYIAIVLEQGNYLWQEQFLKDFDQDGSIKQLFATQVKPLKLATRQVLFKQWETSLSFDEHVEAIDG